LNYDKINEFEYHLNNQFPNHYLQITGVNENILTLWQYGKDYTYCNVGGAFMIIRIEI